MNLGVLDTIHEMINMMKTIELKDKHTGQKCFVIGNGPSLTKEQIDIARNHITIGYYLCKGYVEF